MKESETNRAISRLCDAVERLVDLNRSAMFQIMDQNRKILDRALSVTDWGLSVRRMEEDTSREVASGRRIVVHQPTPQNGEVVPDIYVPDRSNDPHA